MNRPTNSNPNGASAIGSFFVGAFFLVVAGYWPAFMGGAANAASDLYSSIFTFFAYVCFGAGFFGLYGTWRRKIKREESERPSGIFGEAEFATVQECQDAGLLDPEGLYLGVLDHLPLFYKGKAHLLTVAPARQGKATDVVLPNLFHCGDDSIVVTDPKGELAAVTAEHRRKRFGQKVVVLNPWGLYDLPQDRINPLEGLIALASDPARQRGLTDEVKAIALQLLPEPEDTRNRFFREGSREILRGAFLYLALCSPKRCTLPEAWRIIANPRRFGRAVDVMRRSEALGGLLADIGDNLAYQIEDNPDHFADFRAGAVQALDIYEPSGYLADAVSGSDVSLSDLKAEDVTLYLAFPQDRIASHGTALGLIVNQAITAVARAPERGQVLFLLDEFANLGKLAGLAESLTALPGLGVRVWMFVQELAELNKIYGPHTARTIQSQAEVKQFFAVQDLELAKTLSDALGQKTVKTRNFNLGRKESDEVGESLSETGRPLMTPDEIRMMPADEQLLLIKRLKPIKAMRYAFWFFWPWRKWAMPHPTEGKPPKEEPIARLGYALKGMK